MFKLFAAATAAALLALSAASFGQTPGHERSDGATANSVASANVRADWWTALGLTAADVGEAALPFTTHPSAQDEASP